MQTPKYPVSDRILKKYELNGLKKCTEEVFLFYRQGKYEFDKTLVDAYIDKTEVSEEDMKKYGAHEHFEGTPETLYAYHWKSAFVVGFKIGMLETHVKFIVNMINSGLNKEKTMSLMEILEAEYSELKHFALQVKEQKVNQQEQYKDFRAFYE